MHFAIKYTLESDPNKAGLERWLSNQHEVASLVGSDISYVVKSRVSVEETPDAPEYNRYTMLLSGNDRKVRVVVIALPRRGEYRIESIRPL